MFKHETHSNFAQGQSQSIFEKQGGDFCDPWQEGARNENLFILLPNESHESHHLRNLESTFLSGYQFEITCYSVVPTMA